MKFSKYSQLTLVGAVLFTPLAGLGLEQQAQAAEVTVAPVGTAYKTLSTPYVFDIKPKITDMNGEDVTPLGGAYTIKQVEEILRNGSNVAVDGTPVVLNLQGATNTATVSEDGTYTIVNSTRIPGYYKDTKEYKYSIPMVESGKVVSDTNFEVYPKLTPVIGDIEFTKVGEDDKPLANTEFTLYQLTNEATGDVYTEGQKEIAKATTGTEGLVQFKDLPEGKYYIQETKASDSYALDNRKIFYNITTDAEGVKTVVQEVDGDLVNNDTNTFTNYLTPTVDKEVKTVMTDKYSDDLSETTLRGKLDYNFNLPIPKTIDTYKKFTLTDTPDAKLDISKSVDTVKVLADGVELNKANINISLVNGELVLDFNQSAREEMKGKQELRVEFSANLKDTAVSEDIVKNTVTLSYDNGYGAVGDIKDDVDVVLKEGAVKVIKEDGRTNALLPGATFDVYKEVTGTATGKTIEFDGKTYELVTNPRTNEVYEATTDDNGVVEFKNLEFGDYLLVETKAPEGYNLNNEHIPFTIDDVDTQAISGVNDSIAISVDNYKQTDWLPMTGTYGQLGVGGLILLSGAGVVYTTYKRKKENKDSQALA